MHNLIDQKFGSLVVLKKRGYNKYRQDLWECICDCGNIKIIVGASLRRGTTKSCGCLVSKLNRKDISGFKSGKLTAIKFLKVNKDRACIWLCKCECGNFSEVRSSQIISKKTKTCGCGSKIVSGNQLKRKYANPEESSIMSILNSYKVRSNKLSLQFDLNYEDFKFMLYQNCFYCDSSPNREFMANGGSKIVVNGIDRINNLDGYFLKNTVTCCFNCNSLKSNFNLEDLIQKQIRLEKIIFKLKEAD